MARSAGTTTTSEGRGEDRPTQGSVLVGVWVPPELAVRTEGAAQERRLKHRTPPTPLLRSEPCVGLFGHFAARGRVR